MSTMQGDEFVAEKILARGDILRNGNPRVRVLILDPVLSPHALAPRYMVVAGRVALLRGVKALLGDLEELGV